MCMDMDTILYPSLLGDIRKDKILIPDLTAKDVVIRIFQMYLDDSSYSKINNVLDNGKVLNKTNWYDTTIM